MADQARRVAEKKTKKRKSASTKDDKPSKKAKSSAALKTAQEKDAKIRAGAEKPIFIQPSNLAEGCFLKDYQLEGVRWLVSLFENGVSGILADEMVSYSIQRDYNHFLTKLISHSFYHASFHRVLEKQFKSLP
jgi:SNF2 family DNA or RNA helicase